MVLRGRGGGVRGTNTHKIIAPVSAFFPILSILSNNNLPITY